MTKTINDFKKMAEILNGNHPTEYIKYIEESTDLSLPTIRRKLKKFHHPRCQACGKELDDSSLSKKLCDECFLKKLAEDKKIFESLFKEDLKSFFSSPQCNPSLIDSHGDLFTIRKRLGTGRLSEHIADREEDELEMVIRELKRLRILQKF